MQTTWSDILVFNDIINILSVLYVCKYFIETTLDYRRIPFTESVVK